MVEREDCKPGFASMKVPAAPSCCCCCCSCSLTSSWRAEQKTRHSRGFRAAATGLKLVEVAMRFLGELNCSWAGSLQRNSRRPRWESRAPLLPISLYNEEWRDILSRRCRALVTKHGFISKESNEPKIVKTMFSFIIIIFLET